MPQCTLHRIALSPEGECVICRRSQPPKERVDWAGIFTLVSLALLVLTGIQWYRGQRSAQADAMQQTVHAIQSGAR